MGSVGEQYRCRPGDHVRQLNRWMIPRVHECDRFEDFQPRWLRIVLKSRKCCTTFIVWAANRSFDCALPGMGGSAAVVKRGKSS